MTWSDEGWADAAREYHANGRRPASKLAAIAPRRFHLVPFNDLNPGTGPAYLVKGLIPRVGIVAVWGPPKCGKSFWAFDLAMHSALGRDYRGRRVAAGAVVYCAFEGAEGFKARAAAFREHHHLGDVAEVPFFLVPTRMNLVKDHAGLIASIREQVGSDNPVSVVLDTLNRSLAGSESSDEDMTAYLGAADAIREAFNCAVIIVHHCGVDGSRPRGHTSLTGTVDAQLAVKRDAAGNIVVTVECMKDGPEGEVVASRLDRVELGIDEDGDPIRRKLPRLRLLARG
jgi:RecA-family ATPase